jgi:hypothetical protein
MTFHQNPLLRGLKKCCVSNGMNGTEGDVLWEEHSEKILLLVICFMSADYLIPGY